MLESIIYLKQRFENVVNVNYQQIRLLDYGCGFGHVLDLCKSFGIDAVGVEIDKSRLAYCKRKDLNVCKPQELGEGSKFDVIISISVIEHINNLNEYLLYITKRLKIGGIFSFTGLNSKIINIERRKNDYRLFMPIEHINYFTPKSLKLLASKYGFVPVPKVKMVQPVENFTQLFYPVAKKMYKGFYPTGGLKVDLVKVSDQWD